MQNLNQALNHLESKIAAGWDFADACWSAASKWSVPYEFLADAYDDRHADEYVPCGFGGNNDAHCC
jgi:hypothetical protein